MIKNNSKLLFLIFILFSVNSFIFSQTDKIKIPQGIIKGKVRYPSDADYHPEMKVCAVKFKDSTLKYCTKTNAGSDYTIKLPIGIYYVYSYLIDPDEPEIPRFKGYYSDLVLCGLCYECGLRSVLLKVNVEEGKTVSNINPFDFYWHELLIIQEDTIISIKK